MIQKIFCPAKSWADLQQAQAEWLGLLKKPKLMLIPATWSSAEIQPLFPDCRCLTTTELLEHYLQFKYKQPQLLAKQSLEQLLLSIIYQSQADDKTAASRYFNIQTYHQGYVRALTEFLLDFRENGQDDLLKVLSAFKNQALSAKERDLIDVHQELDDLLHQQNLFDYRRAIFDFNDDKENGHPSKFVPDLPDCSLAIFGFNFISPLESKFLGRLLFRVPQVAFAYCENKNAAEPTFRNQNSVRTFVEKGLDYFTENSRKTEIQLPQNSPLQPLAEMIFHDAKPQQLSTENCAAQINLANDRLSEITAIARKIRHLHSQGQDFTNMRLVLPNYELYTCLLQEVFPRYEIPYSLQKGVPLKFFPLAQLIHKMVNLPGTTNPFPVREHIFSSAYVSFSGNVTVGNLLEFLGEYNLLQPEIEVAIQKKLPETTAFDLDYEWLLNFQRQAMRSIRSKEKLHPVQIAVKYLEKIYADKPNLFEENLFKIVVNYYLVSCAERAVYPWRREMTSDEFVAAVEKLLTRFQIEKNIEKFAAAEDSYLKDVANKEKLVLRTIRNLTQKVARQFRVLSQSTESKFSINDLINSFNGLASIPDFFVPASESNGVPVCTTENIPLTFSPTTFVCGLVDSEFPAQEPFNFLQPKSEGRVLSGEQAFVDRDRHLFYQIIASTSEQIFISAPHSDGGKSLLISPFVTEVQKCFGNKPEAEPEEFKIVYSTREQLVFLGRTVDRNFELAQPVLSEMRENSPEFFEQIIRIFECDGLRASISKFSQFDGVFLENNSSRNDLKLTFGDDFTFTNELLERYAGCPLRFLFQNILTLLPKDWNDYHPDTTDRGVLVRTILNEYTKSISKEKQIPKDAEEILHQAAVRALADLIDEKDDVFNYRFRQGLLSGLNQTEEGRRRRPGLFAAFLNHERTAPDLISPFLSGKEIHKDENVSTIFNIAGLQVEIQIDRVDVTDDQKDAIIYNYSVGDLGNVEAIGKGLQFKLPLQILALRDFCKKNGIRVEVSGAGTYLVKTYRNIKRGGYFAIQDLQATRKDNVNEKTPIYSGQRRYGFLPAANFELALKNTQERIQQIHELIFNGCFNLPICALRDQICANCQFTRICRKDQLRLDKLYTVVDGDEVYKPLRRLL